MIKAETLRPEKTTLASSLAEAQRHVGVLHLNGTPGATIRADGVLVGRLPYEGGVRLSEGTRHMLATAPGYSPEGLDVEIKGDHEFEATFILHPVVVSKPQTSVPPVPILEDEAPKPVPTKTLIGLGLLSLGAAPATFGALLLRYDGEYLRGGVLLGVGAALMAEGFNLYWRGIHSEKSSMSVVLAPSSVTLNGQSDGRSPRRCPHPIPPVDPNTREVIGGAAAALRYGAKRNTSDIDTFNDTTPEVERAVRVTQQKLQLGIVVSKAAIADPPWNFEDRLEELAELGLGKLKVQVPERHDLALMKTVRGYTHDLEVLQEMHRDRPFDLDTLVTRFKSEMGQAVTDHRLFRINFQVLIERTFGSSTAVRVRDDVERDAQTRHRGLGL
jgi:hypothetical protein